MNGRERINALFKGQEVDCLPLMPITMMFAADQIGIKYGAYATNHRLLVEAQIATAEKYDLDYVSVISDPAREAADCGAAIQIFEDQPPGFDENRALLSDKSTLKQLKVPDPHSGSRMLDRVQAVALFKTKIAGQKLIEGWIEGPCAQAADLRGINNLMTDFMDDPAFVRDLFDFVLEMEILFAQAQINAGAQLIGIGDAAASLTGPRIYNEFILPYEKKMVDAIHAMGIPIRLHICGNTRKILSGMGSLGCEIVDLDLAPLNEARQQMGPDQILLGNIHPVHVLRNGNPTAVTSALTECHQQSGSRFIVGAGCEVARGTPHANMMAMTDYARSHK